MSCLVAGATGATGRLLVQQLIDRGQHVRVIVRSAAGLPESARASELLTVKEASLLDLDERELAAEVEGCDVIASCLGHNLSFKGIFGPPRRLVTEATERLCRAIRSARRGQLTRFVLMNTVANRNLDLNEKVSFADRFLVGILRLLVPPQADNEQAANFLRAEIGREDGAIAWAVVRPDSLIDEDRVTEYDLHPSPTRGVLLNTGRTSRVNVAHFMAELMTEEETWSRWKGQMPVIYNRSTS